ncbi:MAG: SGNH/GDSL hydrolase family protein [Planctomycetaceae bacterium]|nr:SGNH/GDSL hydrolase family protein [Planctomycetaceae bacterium]
MTKRMIFLVLPWLGNTDVLAQTQSSADAAATDTPAAADPFAELKSVLQKTWPHNRQVRLVFHGHSVPAGYFRTPQVRRFDSYPALVHQRLCDRYPTAVIDVCTTAIGGEHAADGAARFADDVLTLKPDVVFIDYSLNDRSIGLAAAEKAWRQMIEKAIADGVQVVLLTPTPDTREDILSGETPLARYAASVRSLGQEYGVPVVDSYAAFQKLAKQGQDLTLWMSQSNHPNRKGHQVVTDAILTLLQ